MIKDKTDYNRVIEDLRHSYNQKYGVHVNDELLYMVVRINEVQVAVNKKIDDIPKISFQAGKDYF